MYRKDITNRLGIWNLIVRKVCIYRDLHIEIYIYNGGDDMKRYHGRDKE